MAFLQDFIIGAGVGAGYFAAKIFWTEFKALKRRRELKRKSDLMNKVVWFVGGK